MDIALDISTWQGMTRALTAQGHEVRLLVSCKDIENRLGGKCISMPVIRKKVFRLLSLLVIGYIYANIHIFRFRPKIVICDIFTCIFTFPLGSVFGKLFKTKFIIDNRTFFFGSSKTLSDKIKFYLTKIALSYARMFFHGLTAINSFLRDQIVALSGYPKVKTCLWSSGVNLDLFSPEQVGPRPEWMREKFIVMQHGSLSLNRGLLETVEAFKYVQNKNICLVLVGKGVAEKAIRLKVDELDLAERVKIHPPVSYENVPELINHADVGILAYPDTDYWRGNNPLKLLEYMAMKKPIICTDMSTFREVLQDSSGCFYLSHNDPEEIARTINLCYQQREKIMESCDLHREIILRRYTWEKQALKLIDFFNNLRTI